MFFLANICAVFFMLTYIARADNVVDLGYVKYRGNITFPNTVAFLGIPYAEAPVGDRRFRAPLPLNVVRLSEQADGVVVDATSYPQFCVQGTTGYDDAGGAGSEDCLKVNVYAPLDAKPGNNLPVMVYFHGGGYIYGNPAEYPFDHWIHQVPDVVAVSVYYRLDVFGFLAHSAFTTSPELGDLNVGFQDQIEALHWVQEHIAAFGGDPARVTIAGQSAGGASVELHLVTPQSEGLFSQGIAQSVYRTPLPTPEQQEPLFNFFAQKAGCGSSSVTDQMACLRNAPLTALAPAQDAQFSGSSYNKFHPVFDGNTIVARPTAAFTSGQFKRTNILVGAASNETLLGAPDFTPLLKGFFPQLTKVDLDEFIEQYPPSEFSSADEQIRAAIGESQLRCATEIMGKAFSQGSQAFVYRYNTPAGNPVLGTAAVEHSADIWMQFKGVQKSINGSVAFTTMTPSQEAFAQELIAYWLSFVRTGDPNTFKLARAPIWPSYSANNAQRVVLTEGSVMQTGSTVETVSIPENRRCNFVASKATDQQN